MKTIKVLDKNGNETGWEVLENTKTNYYNVFSPSGRSDKNYRSLKMVEKYLAKFNLVIA